MKTAEDRLGPKQAMSTESGLAAIFYSFPELWDFQGMEANLLEAVKEAHLEPDMQIGKELAQSKPRRQVEG